MTTSIQRLLVRRDDLASTRLEEQTLPPLARGEISVRVDRFALTANNITYAAFGEAMSYWRFFPAEEGWGCIPVWGFGDVVSSKAEGVREGERVYGYMPMGSHVVLQPGRVRTQDLADAAPHRQGLPAVYNRYLRCSADPGYRADHEAHQALLRPLFTTSFLIDDFLADADFFGARSVLMSSASSKTAWGTAHCLSRRADDARPRVVGLSSPANIGYANSLGCYDEVLPYDAVGELKQVPTVYVDFAGDAALRRAVHEHFGDALAYSCSVGGTHWQGLGGAGGLPGPRPVLFFAPAQIAKRSEAPPKGWGPQGLNERLSESWEAMIAKVSAPGSPWLQVVERRGGDAVRETYLELLRGRTDPAQGLMLGF